MVALLAEAVADPIEDLLEPGNRQHLGVTLGAAAPAMKVRFLHWRWLDGVCLWGIPSCDASVRWRSVAFGLAADKLVSCATRLR